VPRRRAVGGDAELELALVDLDNLLHDVHLCSRASDVVLVADALLCGFVLGRSCESARRHRTN
jgi:hypothetical protein